jgi:hypothetical protein
MVRALRGGVYLTRQELKTVLKRAGIHADGVQRLAHIVMQAELDAVVCSGPRRGKQATYALFDERVPAATPVARDDALARLADRYFTSHGPAQIQDFAWWSGLTMTDARSGLTMVERGLTRAIVGGKTYWFKSSGRSAGSAPIAHLLPLYDEYLIAYKDRSAAFGRSQWTSTAGDAFSAPVIVNGLVVGQWKRRVHKDGTVVAVTPLRLLRDFDTRMIVNAARAYGRFFGLDIELSWTR